MNVLITGAGGFIAGHLAKVLCQEGWRVIGVDVVEFTNAHFGAVYKGALGESLSELFAKESIDAVVHAANAVGPDEYRLNVDGTTRWFQEAREAGVKLQILLSSISARPDALADYGKAKYALESVFAQGGEVAFRLGVVVGRGGMFARILKSLEGPFTPLLDGGAVPVYVLGVNFLCQVLRDTIRDGGGDLRGKYWRIYQPDPFTLKEVLETIRRVAGLRCALVPVPSLPVLWALTVTEKLGLRLPVDTTNVRGLRQGRREKFESDFERFGYQARPLDALVREALDKNS